MSVKPATRRKRGLNANRSRFCHIQAFTLLELLTVVAIIGVLATLLFASLTAAKSKAESTVCKNNLRQLGLAMNLYLGDSGAFVPEIAWRDVPVESRKVSLWFEVIGPYVGARWPSFNSIKGVIRIAAGTFVCPGYNRFPGVYVGGTGTPSEFTDLFYGAYGYNVNGVAVFPEDDAKPLGLGGWADGEFGNVWHALKEGAVLNPSDMIVFGDSTIHLSPIGTMFGSVIPTSALGELRLGMGFYDVFLAGKGNTAVQEAEKRRSQYKKRHEGRFNITFCDGHVETLSPEQLFRIRNPKIASRWNNDNQPHLDKFHP